MKVKDRSCLNTLTTIAILFFIVRLIMVFSDPSQDLKTVSKTFWEPIDMWLLLFSIFFTLLPEPCSAYTYPKENSSKFIKHIDFLLGCKSGTLFTLILLLQCTVLNYMENEEIMTYSSYALVVGILIDHLAQTYNCHPLWRLSLIWAGMKHRNTKKVKLRPKDATKALIGYHKKRMRRLTISLGNSKGVIVSIFVLTVLLVISYSYEGAWISNVLISIGAGIVTGLVFYFLSNYRNNKMAQLQSDISALAPVMSALSDVSHYETLAKWSKILGRNQMSQEDIAYEIMECIDNLSETIGKIGYELYQELELDIDNPINKDKCKALRDSLEKNEISIDYKTWSISTYKDLIGLHDKVDSLLKDKKDTLEILQKHIF